MFRRSWFFSIILLILIFSSFSCKRESNNLGSALQKGSLNYPRESEQIMNTLAPKLSSELDFVVFVASYGILVENLNIVKEWGIVAPAEMESVFQDFGIHYQLNPALLESYQKAGLNPGGGFGIGSYKGFYFMLLEISNKEAFSSFFDNFLNEEFGRPRYHEESIDGLNLTQINVLKKDAFTLHYENDLVWIVRGEGESKAEHSSLTIAQELLAKSNQTLDNDEIFLSLKGALAKEQFAVYAPNSKYFERKFGEKAAKIVSANFSAFGAALKVESNRLLLRSLAKISETPSMNFDIFETSATPLQATDTILSNSPSSGARISFNFEKLEHFALSMLPENFQQTWQNVKSKLNQRLLGINLESQILGNLSGQIWLNLYEMNTDEMRQTAAPIDAIPAISGALFIPFREASVSDGFFNKINALSRLLPANRIQVENLEGLLHVSTKLKPDFTLHAAYYSGLLAVFTEKAWPKVRESLLNPMLRESEAYKVLLDKDNSLALALKVENLIQYLGVKYEIISVQISKFLAPFKRVELSGRTGEGFVMLEAAIEIEAVKN